MPETGGVPSPLAWRDPWDPRAGSLSRELVRLPPELRDLVAVKPWLAAAVLACRAADREPPSTGCGCAGSSAAAPPPDGGCAPAVGTSDADGAGAGCCSEHPRPHADGSARASRRQRRRWARQAPRVRARGAGPPAGEGHRPEASFTGTAVRACDPGVVPEPSVEDGHTGLDSLRFQVMRDPREAPQLMDARLAENGTSLQLLRDAERLGVTAIRQLEQADAHLETLWKGCSDYTALDSNLNVWTPPGGTPMGWSVTGVPIASEAWTATERCGSPEATFPAPGSCPATATRDLPDDAPPVFTQALLDLAERARARSIVPVPVLLGQSDRDQQAQCAPGAQDYYAWEYVDAAGAVEQEIGAAQFRLLDVDARGGGEDQLLGEFVRQLVGPSGVAAWGADGDMPYVQLGNELDHGVGWAAHGWLVLRLCELLDACAPSLLRVFPALASPSTTEAATYTDSVRDELDRVFYHLVRAALIVRYEDAATGDADRFASVLPGIELAWTTDPDSLATFLGVASPETTHPRDVLAAVDCDDPGTGAVAVYPHMTELKRWCARHLQAPFHVLDFHWYANKGDPVGRFFPLSGAGPYVEALEVTLGSWWSNDADIDLWCTETGISGALCPQHFHEARATLTDAYGVPCLECYFHLDSGHRVVDVAAGATPDYNAFSGYEYRVDPEVARAWFGNDLNHWASWLFTSREEQARQVWTRLSYFAGVGVDRVFWFTNQAHPLKGQPPDQEPQDFYGYGLTDDTVTSLWTCTDPEHACDCTEVDCGFDAGGDYVTRAKTPAFCALRRWNQYLDAYQRAVFLPDLDGVTHPGLYAVLFLRAAGSMAGTQWSAERYPYAVVAWADPQAYDWGAYLRPPDLERGDPAVGVPGLPDEDSDPPDTPARSLYFLMDDPSDPAPATVATVPRVPEPDPRLGATEPLCNPCLDAGEAPDEGTGAGFDYEGPQVLQFSAHEVATVTSFPGTVAALHPDDDPVLLLLPDGGIRLDALPGVELASGWPGYQVSTGRLDALLGLPPPHAEGDPGGAVGLP